MSVYQILLSIAKILSKHNVAFKEDLKNECLWIAFDTQNLGQILVRIGVRDGGAWLDFCVSQLLQVNESVFKGVLFQTLLIHAWETPMVRFFYNPNTGYLSASIDLPLVDMTLTEGALIFCANQLVRSVDAVMPRLQSVLAKGQDPGRKSPTQKALEGMSLEQLEYLEQQIALQKQQKGDNA